MGSLECLYSLDSIRAALGFAGSRPLLLEVSNTTSRILDVLEQQRPKIILLDYPVGQIIFCLVSSSTSNIRFVEIHVKVTFIKD